MEIEQFNQCLELTCFRETRFFTSLRPYIHKRLDYHKDTKGFLIFAEDEKGFSNEDRFFAKLDILFGQIFKNIQARQYWKGQLSILGQSERVSLLALSSLHQVYINELVILYERLARFLVLIEKAFGKDIEVKDLEKQLLRFFNPILFDKRNYNQHRQYLGFPGQTELIVLEEKALRNDFLLQQYCQDFDVALKGIMSWIDYTEKKTADFIKKYLNNLEAKINFENEYMIPRQMPPNFSFEDKLESSIRRRYNHENLFKDL